MLFNVYEFKCPSCEKEYVREQSSLMNCPVCNVEMNMTHIMVINSTKELMRTIFEGDQDEV